MHFPLRAVFAVFLCLAVGGCQTHSETAPLRIGVMIEARTLEKLPVVQAIELLLEQTNAAGGLQLANGDRVPAELVVKSDFVTQDEAVVAIRELIYQEKVTAVIGPLLSRNAIPAGDVAESVGVPMISPGSTHPDTTAGKRWVFRMSSVNAFQGQSMAHFAFNDLDATTAAVLYDVSEPFSRGVGKVFQEAFTAAGGRVVASEPYTPADQNFDERLAKIGALEPGVLFLPNPNSETIPQAVAARRLGLDAVILGCDAWTVARLVDAPELEGAFAFQHWHPDLGATTPETASFVNLYRERFGLEPSDSAALSWDAAGLILAAAARGGVDPASIRDHLEAMENYRGASGPITYAGYGGDPPKSAVIVRIGEGRVNLDRQLPPPASAATDGL